MNQNEMQDVPAESAPPEQKKTILKIYSVAGVLTILILIVSILYSILIQISPYRLAAGGVCVILWMLSRKKEKLTGLFEAAALLAAIQIGFLCITPPFIFGSHSLWKYPLQKACINFYQNIKEPDYFPDFTPDVVSDYTFSYTPSILQGAGNYCVSFVTTPEKAKEYEKIYSEQANYIIPLSELWDHCYYPDENNDNRVISIATDTLWKESSYGEFETEINAEIYILHANENWNHPHTSAVIIDSSDGRIQFSQLG